VLSLVATVFVFCGGGEWGTDWEKGLLRLSIVLKILLKKSLIFPVEVRNHEDNSLFN
jgi:hypothetical protein